MKSVGCICAFNLGWILQNGLLPNPFHTIYLPQAWVFADAFCYLISQSNNSSQNWPQTQHFNLHISTPANLNPHIILLGVYKQLSTKCCEILDKIKELGAFSHLCLVNTFYFSSIYLTKEMFYSLGELSSNTKHQSITTRTPENNKQTDTKYISNVRLHSWFWLHWVVECFVLQN